MLQMNYKILKLASDIRTALNQFEESVHNADGTSASKFETLKSLLTMSNVFNTTIWKD